MEHVSKASHDVPIVVSDDSVERVVAELSWADGEESTKLSE